MKKIISITILLLFLITNSILPESNAQIQTEQDVMGRRFTLSQLQEDYEQLGTLVNWVLIPKKTICRSFSTASLVIANYLY